MHQVVTTTLSEGGRHQGDLGWYTMDDSQIKPAATSLLAGDPPEKLVDDDNVYIHSLRCKQAASTPEYRVPLPLVARGFQRFHRLGANLVCAHGILSSDSNRTAAAFDFPAIFPQLSL